MPFEMAMASEISRLQFYQRAQQALNELEALQSQDREDAERYRWLRKRDWFDGPLCVLRDPKRVFDESVRFLGVDCPSRERLDEAIDHARRIEGEGE